MILLGFVSSCARRTQTPVVPGVTTASGLKQNLGEPVTSWSPPSQSSTKMLAYPGGTVYQVDRDLVVAESRDAVGEETTLQYWRHKWIGDSQRFEEIPGTTNNHGQRRYQFASKQAGMTVIYDEADSRVSHVVRYEAR